MSRILCGNQRSPLGKTPGHERQIAPATAGESERLLLGNYSGRGRTLASLAVSALEWMETQYSPKWHTTYGEVTEALGHDPTRESLTIGASIANLIDAGCFYSNLPFFAFHFIRVKEGEHSDKAFSEPPWSSHRDEFIRNARNHRWTAEDFKKLKRVVSGLEGSPNSYWDRIDSHGEKAIQRALAAK